VVAIALGALLRFVLPVLGGHALTLGGALAGTAAATALAVWLNHIREADRPQKVELLHALHSAIPEILQGKEVREALEEIGLNVVAAQQLIRWAIEEEVKALQPPPELPTFASTTEALAWWERVREQAVAQRWRLEDLLVYGQHLQTELARLAAAVPAPAPQVVVQPAPVAIPAPEILAQAAQALARQLPRPQVQVDIHQAEVVGALTSLQQTLAGSILSTAQTTTSALARHQEGVSQAYQEGAERIGAAIGAQAGVLATPLAGMENSLIRNLPLVGAGVAGIAGVLTGVNILGARRFGHAMSQGRAQCIGITSLGMLGQLGMAAGALSLPIIFNQVPYLREIQAGAFEWLLELWLGPLRQKGQVRPEDGPEMAVALLNATVAMGMAAHMAAVAGEAAAPLKHMGLGYVAGFLGELAGWSRIATGTVGIIETLAISQPMRYYVNSLLRPYLPTVRDLQELRSRRTIDEATWWAEMGYWGYGDRYHPWFSELTNTPLRYFALRAIAGAGFWDEDFFRQETLRSGYSDPAVQALLRMFRSESERRSRERSLSPLRRLYREGWLGDDEAREELKRLELSDANIEWELLAWQRERDYDFREDQARVILRGFTRGLITRNDALSSLITLGMSPDRARLRIILEQMGLLPRARAEEALIPERIEVLVEE